MGDIILKKTDPTTLLGVSHAPYTYHIRNLGDLTIDLGMPTTVFSLPEEKDTAAIGMKVEGNTSQINLSWTLVNESSTVVDELTGGDAVETADEQMAFLMDTFQSSGIEHAYELKLMPNSGSTPFFTRTGALTKIAVTKSGDSPVTYNASVTFAVADMVASTNIENNPAT